VHVIVNPLQQFHSVVICLPAPFHWTNWQLTEGELYNQETLMLPFPGNVILPAK